MKIPTVKTAKVDLYIISPARNFEKVCFQGMVPPLVWLLKQRHRASRADMQVWLDMLSTSWAFVCSSLAVSSGFNERMRWGRP